MSKKKLSAEEDLSKSISNLDTLRIRKIIRDNPNICKRRGYFPLIELMYCGEGTFHQGDRLNKVFEIGDILINEGRVDINAIDNDIICITAVYAAVYARSYPKLLFLLDRGAEAHNKRWKITSDHYPLFYAIRQFNKYMVELLLENGADVNARDEESGNSTLYYAITLSDNHRKERYDICKMLLDMGAKANQRCFYFDGRRGGSALSYALSVARTDIALIQLLKARGA